MLGKLEKNEIRTFLILYTTVLSKWIKDLNVGLKTIKILEVNIGRTLWQKEYFFWNCLLTWRKQKQKWTVQFSHSVISDSLRLHEPQHARPPCPLPAPRVYPTSCPSSRRCDPTISSSVVPFSSCPQSLPASGSFQIRQLFTSGGQSIGASASTSVLPMNTQDWSPLGWTGWISLQSKTLSNKQMRPNSTQKLLHSKGNHWQKDSLLNGRKYLQMIWQVVKIQHT